MIAWGRLILYKCRLVFGRALGQTEPLRVLCQLVPILAMGGLLGRIVRLDFPLFEVTFQLGYYLVVSNACSLLAEELSELLETLVRQLLETGTLLEVLETGHTWRWPV
jgi:hypothetical protein